MSQSLMIPCAMTLAGEAWRLEWSDTRDRREMAVVVDLDRRVLKVNRRADRGAVAGQMAVAINGILTGTWEVGAAKRLDALCDPSRN